MNKHVKNLQEQQSIIFKYQTIHSLSILNTLYLHLGYT